MKIKNKLLFLSFFLISNNFCSNNKKLNHIFFKIPIPNFSGSIKEFLIKCIIEDNYSKIYSLLKTIYPEKTIYPKKKIEYMSKNNVIKFAAQKFGLPEHLIKSKI